MRPKSTVVLPADATKSATSEEAKNRGMSFGKGAAWKEVRSRISSEDDPGPAVIMRRAHEDICLENRDSKYAARRAAASQRAADGENPDIDRTLSEHLTLPARLPEEDPKLLARLRELGYTKGRKHSLSLKTDKKK
eukprot:SAG11_NODE_2901_length_2849_cov_4.048727_3_plen_136_part_00